MLDNRASVIGLTAHNCQIEKALMKGKLVSLFCQAVSCLIAIPPACFTFVLMFCRKRWFLVGRWVRIFMPTHGASDSVFPAKKFHLDVYGVQRIPARLPVATILIYILSLWIILFLIKIYLIFRQILWAPTLLHPVGTEWILKENYHVPGKCWFVLP